MAPLVTFAVKTFGCKVNQYDSQLLAETLSALGLRRVPERIPAASPAPSQPPDQSAPDLIVVNTCAVTRRSEAKARRFVRACLRRHPAATVVVTGCGVRRAERSDDPVARWWKDASARSHRLLLASQPSEVPLRLREAGLLEGVSTPEAAPTRIGSFAGHDRAFVKVQDGCQSFCSYCIVPYVRPGLWSKPAEEAVGEVAGLAQAGYGEVVLVGVHLGLYADAGPAGAGPSAADGRRGKTGLPALLRRLLEETEVGRLRLSSIEPHEVTEELIDLVAGSSRLCPHFHLPLQSGDDRILRAMNRRYSAGDYLRTLERIARKVPRPSFTTDVMVGFPGEGEEEFARTLRVCREAGFSRIHVFRFDPRPGTRAAVLPERPPAHLVRRREQQLLALARELARSYREQFVGEEVEVLVEARRDPATGEHTGLTERYLRIRFPDPPARSAAGPSPCGEVRPGTLVNLRVTAADESGLVGSWSPSAKA